MSPVTIWQKICAGLFLVLAVSVWIFMSIVLSGPQGGRHYYTILGESVRGLSPGSLVCFNGIEIGKVTKVSNDFTINKVRVDFAVTEATAQIFADFKEGNKTKPGTKVQLITSFVTGIQYVDLTGGFANYPLLPDNSQILSMDTDFAKLSKQVGGIVANLEEIFTPQSLENLRDVMVNLNKFSQHLNDDVMGDGPATVLQKLKKILDNMDSLSGPAHNQYVETTLKNLAAMSDAKQMGVQDFVQNLSNQSRELLQTMNTLITNVNQIVNSSGKKEDIASLVKEINSVLTANEANIQKTFANLERLSALTNSQLAALMKDTNSTVRTLNYFVQKELTQTNQELQGTLKELASLLRILKVKPNALLWGSEVRGQ
jgi:ABC-type transporter Mla subunit MlaD